MTDAPLTDAPLPDGTYDVLVVDVDEPTEAGPAGVPISVPIGVEVVVTAGEAKGETIRIGLGPADDAPSGPTEPADPINLLGLPGVLTVEHGRPRLTLDG